MVAQEGLEPTTLALEEPYSNSNWVTGLFMGWDKGIEPLYSVPQTEVIAIIRISP